MAPVEPVQPEPAVLRAGVAKAVRAVIGDARTIDWVLDYHPEWVPNATAKDILYGVIRHYFSLSHALLKLLKKPLKNRDLDVYAVMLVGAYQITHTTTPTYAAVDEAVNAAGLLRKHWAKAVINRVLRHFEPPKRSFDHPEWMIAAIQEQYGQAASDVLFANNARAPMVLRVNQARITPAAYQTMLHDANIGAHTGSVPGSLVLDSPRAASSLPGWSNGLIAVQDMGAQQVAHVFWRLLDARLPSPHPIRILDACAAPGGKLAHLLEQLHRSATEGVEVYGLDLNPTRLEDTRRLLQRLGHAPSLIEGDATGRDWWDDRPFDFVLLDAPCSGTGTIRRHPDIKLLVEPADVAQHARRQLAMLNNLWHTLAPGGTLLYCTCSLLQEENDNVVERFTMQSDAEVLPLTAFTGMPTPSGWQTLPTDPHTDGFYCAALRRAEGGSP